MIDKNRTRTLVVLSLGAGVQSSTMALMAAKGDLPKVDCAIFADTMYENSASYKYLKYLESLLPFPIYKVSKGNIKEDMLAARGTTDFVVAPFYTQETISGKKGMIRRQCTSSYKIVPIQQKIRELCGVGYGKHFPKDKYVEQWIGINFIIPEKSACICCPFHDDKYWKNLKIKYPTEFADAVALDKEIRTISKDKNIKNYTHRSCKPLDEVDFDPDKNQLDMFENECEGVCMI